MLNICITFDYELFFGENYGSYDDVLFAPTSKLMEMLVEEGISATFFVDICSAMQCEKNGDIYYSTAFNKQIKEMYLNNQDVQLHIHPHWLTSKKNGDKWDFDNKSYRIHYFGFNDEGFNAKEIIASCVSYLNGSLREIDESYTCVAYRAGGFAIQPHNDLVKALHNNGIKVDSSVAPKLFSSGGTNYYDYRKEIKKTNWWISNESDWNIDNRSENSLYEIPIATIDKNIITFLIKRLTNRNTIKFNMGERRGTYISMDTKKGNRIDGILHYLFNYGAITLDGFKAKYVYDQLKRYLKKNGNETDQTIAIIGHPKLINDEYINNLRELIKMINSDCNMQIKSISQAYKEIESNGNS